jgi:2-dehydropantoate 2-reductase
LKVGIYGAGAIGGWIGARLVATGHEVSLLARNANLAAIVAQGGLKLEDHLGNETLVNVNASDKPSDLGPQDLIVIAVKSQAMSDVAAAIAPMMSAQTIVMPAMNGVPWWFLNGFGGAISGTQLCSIDPFGTIAKNIPAAQVLGCVVHASCATPAPGKVKQNFGNKLLIGEPSGKVTERLLKVSTVLRDAGFETVASSEIQKDVWFKLWGNMTVNPIAAFTGATTDKILGDDLVKAFVSAIMLEAKDIGAKLGIAIDQQPEDRHAVTAKLGVFKPSMLQDVEAGKSVELDALVTVVQELGMLTKVPTPNTNILLGLSRLHARTHGLYPM